MINVLLKIIFKPKQIDNCAEIPINSWYSKVLIEFLTNLFGLC